MSLRCQIPASYLQFDVWTFCQKKKHTNGEKQMEIVETNIRIKYENLFLISLFLVLFQ